MRTKPYTELGIRRIPCLRCGRPSTQQWQICSDGNQYRGLCTKCDIALNKLVLKFVRIKDWKEKIKSYKFNLLNKKNE